MTEDEARSGATSFADGKDQQAFRTIGEVSAALAIKPHVLRYWEEQFEMLRPAKRSGGRRHYRPEDVALLRRIDVLLNQQGMTIRGARKLLLEDGKSRSAASTAPQAPAYMPATGQTERAAADAAMATPGWSGAAAVAARLRAIRNKLADALD
ncbi:MerR family transcriptional regulator [Croceicoccus sp. F390]|uniref:MerR family transcriptional regulator n=1 Tax=Croceicoccus esteveae TaxID=3075597 RepID=A0ABU2ZEM5_9SPHN|nr:MerR family transcriptional regulator [Croceicoccus sp. F390]MDT0575050.1 MerR family transcriptional regulator [Croceicoccus sp. F390]